MKKLLFSLFFLTSSFLYSGIYDVNLGYVFHYESIAYDDFALNLWTPEWQPRRHYYGIFPSSIGYFYIVHSIKNISIYGSNRYVLEDNTEAFYQSLDPLVTNLLPYATPDASQCLDCHILSEEDTTICNVPAKKVVFDLLLPDEKEEIVISYIFTMTKIGILSNSIMGYTYSISCQKEEVEKEKELINKIIRNLEIQ